MTKIDTHPIDRIVQVCVLKFCLQICFISHLTFFRVFLLSVLWFPMASDHNFVCRCCRSSVNSLNMVKLATSAPHLEATFEEILARVTGTDRKPLSGPSAICVKCSEVLIAADELRILTIESDEFFRNMSGDVKVEKLEVDVDHLGVVGRRCGLRGRRIRHGSDEGKQK
jgi:hypothetical protein